VPMSPSALVVRACVARGCALVSRELWLGSPASPSDWPDTTRHGGDRQIGLDQMSLITVFQNIAGSPPNMPLEESLTVHKAAHYVCLAQFAERTSTLIQTGVGATPQRKPSADGGRDEDQPPASRPLQAVRYGPVKGPHRPLQAATSGEPQGQLRGA
jgi:hypothetical protein